jgi:pSer/pThr/pTyr-binding forkhead associated (FHA) protein
VPNNSASSGVDVFVDDPAPASTPAPSANRAASVAEPIPIPNTVMFDSTAAPTQTGAHLINVTTNRTFPLSNSRTLIGRATNCDIVLDDLNASRTHAEIFQESPTVWGLADLGSTNGTLVNGRHIASVLLNDGDRITIGTTTFVFGLQ